jgi:hypothetical protein
MRIRYTDQLKPCYTLPSGIVVWPFGKPEISRMNLWQRIMAFIGKTK